MQISKSMFYPLIICLTICVISCQCYMIAETMVLADAMTIAMVTIPITFLCYLYCAHSFDFMCFFMLLAWVFSIGGLVPEFYNWTDTQSLMESYGVVTLTQGVCFLTLSMNLMAMGGILAKLVCKPPVKTTMWYIPESMLRGFGWFFLAISIIPTIVYVLNCLRYVMVYGYGEGIYKAGVITDSSFFISLKNYFPYGIYILITTGKDKSGARLPVIIGATYAFAMMIVGQRITVVAFLIGMLYCYHYAVESVWKYRKWIFFGLLAALIVLPVLSTYRLLARSEWSMETFLSMIDIRQGFIGILMETGGSIKPLLDCISEATFANMKLNGASYLHSLALSIFPSSIVKLFYAPAYSSLQVYYTSIVAPITHSMGGSMGFSMFAEAYLNFHGAGVLILGLIGYVFTRIQDRAIINYKAGRVLALPFVCFLAQRILFYVRSDSYDFYGNIKLVLYLIVGIWMYSRLVNGSRGQ